MFHELAHWFMHFTGSDNVSGPFYGFWSGFGSDLGEYVIATSIFSGLIFGVRKHNCHVKGCKSVITSNDPEVHAPACRKHHSIRHKHGRDPHAAA
jgi:hypothetical protein